MINGKRIVIVMPPYSAAKTLATTLRELPEAVDLVLVVDDHSSDETVSVAQKLELKVFAPTGTMATDVTSRPVVARRSELAQTSS